jgi:hypothetical protein
MRPSLAETGAGVVNVSTASGVNFVAGSKPPLGVLDGLEAAVPLPVGVRDALSDGLSAAGMEQLIKIIDAAIAVPANRAPRLARIRPAMTPVPTHQLRAPPSSFMKPQSCLE